MNDPATVHRATPQLIELARHVRPDWPGPDVRAVLAHAATIGMTWEQALTGLCRLMTDPRARPAELIPGIHHPLRRRARLNPAVTRRHAEKIRATLHQEATDADA